MVASTPTTPRKVADPEDNIPCKTPSPRSSASQAPPNPRHNEDEPTPRVNPHASASSHPFKGFGRKFMSKKAAHGDDLDDRIYKKSKEALERAKKLDLGPALGVHDTVNVRERVRRWQAAGGGVVNGDPVEMPPITPATPTPPAPRKRGLSTVTVESDLRSSPLVPPDVIMKELREEWESASDADKQAVRRRARSIERERKMKRRRDRERELGKSSVGAQTELEVEVIIEGAELGATEAGSGVSKSVVYDEDGIRIAPMRVKRRGSGSRRKKKKEKETFVDKAAEAQTDNDVGGGVKVEPETEVEEEGGGVKVEVKAWEYDDGIRIYTNKPRSPALIRSQGSGHTNSVRKGEKSVRARKEEFEAEMRRERKAAREFEALVKKQEAEEAEEREKQRREDEERIRKEQEACEKAEAGNIEGSTIVGDTESAQKKWDEYDDGIRVRPLKNKGTRRKKGAGGSTEKLGAEREASIAEESIAESEREREREREIEKEKKRLLELELERLEKERQRERELEKLENERQRQRQQEKLERERQRVRELEELERVRSRQRQIDILEKDKELEKERLEKERQHQLELEKLEKEKKRQRELEKALEKEKEKREKEKIRLREKEREMEQERKRERQRMKEREKELEREREKEREKLREKERQLEEERRRDREREREREKEMERERGLLRAKEKEIEREKEREMKRVRDMENQREIERQRERDMEKEMQRRRNEKRRKREVQKQKLRSDSGSGSEEDTESEAESTPIKFQKVPARPLTPEDPLLEFFRKAAKRGNSPRLHEQISQRDSTPPLESAKRWESRKKKESRSASTTPTPKTPSPAPVEEKRSPPLSPNTTNEKSLASPVVPTRPKRVRTKNKNANSTEKTLKKEEKPTSASSSPMSSQEDLALKEKPSSTRSTPQPVEEPSPKDAEPVIDRPPTAHSDASSLQSSKESTIPVSPPPVMPLKLSPKKKESGGGFMPGISSATTSFFKAVSNMVKEELQIVSPRVDESSSEDSEDSEDSEESEDDDTLDQRAETPTREMPQSIKEESEDSEEDSEDDSDEDSEDSLGEDVEEKAKEMETKLGGEPVDEVKPAAKTPPPRNNIGLEDIPQLPLPRRSLRGSTSPPRPKGKHHRSRTEGSVTSAPSVADDASSIAGSEHARTVSLSSVSTVKPLNITPRPTPALKFDPISPPGQISQAEQQTPVVEKNVEEETHDTYTPSVLTKATSLKRKYTKHADLISILSAPKPNKSIRSAARARSHRKANRKVSTLTVTDLMDEIATEEVRYMRELRTLVEDVVPVLFATVLERADDIVRRTSLNGGNSNNHNYSLRTGFGANPTRPIVDMGISLERLKTMHERMPRKPEELLAWATDAKKVYEEYLSVWRMGFQDVVVTLASNLDDDVGDEVSQKQKDEAARKDLELLYSFGVAPTTPSTNYEGDPSTWAMPPPPPPEEDEEKVDVAFLLKRPLVRLKILAKLFKRINILTPSPLALSLSSSFHTLVTMARRKIAEEKARIEDEAAASIDVSKASDIYTLFTKPDISLDPSKRVRARDSFWMKLYHSSGRVIQRNVELILRDPAVKGRPHGGEILICEFGAGVEKWLLFAPVPLAAISSRTGDAAGEIVVMIRGIDQGSQEEWRQILVLQSATAAGFEWVQMFGLMPIPPEGPFGDEIHKPTVLDTVIEESTIASSSRMQTPALKFQKSKPTVDVFSFMEPEPEPEPEPKQDYSIEKLKPEPLFTTPSPKPTEPRSENVFGIPGVSDFKPAETTQFSIPPDFAVTPIIPGGYQFEGGCFEVSNVSVDGTNKEPDDGHVMLASPLRHSPSLHTLSDSAKYAQSESGRSVSGSSIQRSRKASKPLNLRRQSVVSRDDDTRSLSPPPSPRQLDTPRTLSRARSIHLDEERPKALSITKLPLGDFPILSPNRPESPETSSPTKQDTPQPDSPPPVPPHRTPTKSPRSSKSRTPVLAPGSDSPVSSVRSGLPRRRTSSPLKHEYDPSSPSGSEDTEGEEGEVEEGEEEEEGEVEDESEEQDQTTHDEDSSGSSSSSSSEDEDSDDAVSICSEEEDGEYPPPMLSIPRRISKQPSGIIELPRQRPSSVSLASQPTTVTTTTVTATQAPTPTLKFRASVFTWATSQWEKLHPNECRVLITPGHIEGLPSISPPGTPNSQGSIKEKAITGKDGSPSKPSAIALAQKPSDTNLESCMPIFNLDLTPLTPVRRGTAVDISIRTPKNSKFAGTSLMLRCRSPNECESLYNAINLNRIYPANFQAPSTLLSSLAVSEMGASEASSADSNVKRGWGSWGRSKTYRAGITSAPGSVISSSAGQSESSLSSAFSRFRQKNGIIKNSPLSSLASTSSGSINGDGSRGGTPTGVADGNLIFKVRLYRRENSSKWRDLGNSRVSILKPPKTHKHPNATGLEKRIVATNKAGNLVLLDAVLGEASFERVARTGIAVSILVGEGEENGTGVPGGVGGLGAKSTVYMMQMKGEVEAAHLFSIVGKLRY